MHHIEQVIRSISGHNDRQCYEVLYLAVQTVTTSLPSRPLMREIAQDVSHRTARPSTERAVTRALERAAADIWNYGCRSNLEQIYARPLLEPPTAKSIVFALAEYCKENSSIYAMSEQQLKRLLQLLNSQLQPQSER